MLRIELRAISKRAVFFISGSIIKRIGVPRCEHFIEYFEHGDEIFASAITQGLP